MSDWSVTVCSSDRLLRVGWVAVWLGVLVQLAVSTGAAFTMWQDRCFEHIEYPFIPLLYSCGPPSATDVTLGWLATGLTLLGPRSGERSVGKDGVSTGSCRGSTNNKKKKQCT